MSPSDGRDDLEEELATGARCAQDCVAHVMRMGAGRAELPVTHVGEDGVALWRVTVERVDAETRWRAKCFGEQKLARRSAGGGGSLGG